MGFFFLFMTWFKLDEFYLPRAFEQYFRKLGTVFQFLFNKQSESVKSDRHEIRKEKEEKILRKLLITIQVFRWMCLVRETLYPS